MSNKEYKLQITVSERTMRRLTRHSGKIGLAVEQFAGSMVVVGLDSKERENRRIKY